MRKSATDLLLWSALIAALATQAPPASALDYPTRPITLVVPFAPGGSASTVARSVADKMSETLGQQIVIDNRGGAGGTIATRAVAKGAPDGYTILVATSATVGTSPSLLHNLGYDPRQDLDPIGLIAATPNVIVVHPSFPARSLAELIKIGKETATPIPYGSPGTGTLNHLTVELLAYRTGMKLSHVPYKGAAPALNDLLGGQIQMGFMTSLSSVPYFKSGKLRALAVAAPQRLPQLPDVPTMAEAGFPGVEMNSWSGLLAPARTPPEIVAKLNREAVKALQSPDVHDKLVAQGAMVVAGTPQEFATYLKHEYDNYGRLINAIHLSLD